MHEGITAPISGESRLSLLVSAIEAEVTAATAFEFVEACCPRLWLSKMLSVSSL
jgi:hypothetical protein